MADDFSIDIGVDLDSPKAFSELQNKIKSLEDQKSKLLEIDRQLTAEYDKQVDLFIKLNDEVDSLKRKARTFSGKPPKSFTKTFEAKKKSLATEEKKLDSMAAAGEVSSDEIKKIDKQLSVFKLALTGFVKTTGIANKELKTVVEGLKEVSEVLGELPAIFLSLREDVNKKDVLAEIQAIRNPKPEPRDQTLSGFVKDRFKDRARIKRSEIRDSKELESALEDNTKAYKNVNKALRENAKKLKIAKSFTTPEKQNKLTKAEREENLVQIKLLSEKRKELLAQRRKTQIQKSVLSIKKQELRLQIADTKTSKRAKTLEIAAAKTRRDILILLGKLKRSLKATVGAASKSKLFGSGGSDRGSGRGSNRSSGGGGRDEKNDYTGGLLTVGQVGQIRVVRDVSFALRDAGRQFLTFSNTIKGVFAPAIQEGAEFEQSVANVAAVISDISLAGDGAEGRIKKLSQAFVDLATTTEFTAVEIAEASRQLALAGFSDTEIRQSLTAIVDLASATNTELEKTALIAARISRAFDISADNIGNLSDTLATVVSNSNSTLDSIGESFKLGSPIAAAYGQSVEDIAVIFGVLADAGIQGSRAGTAVNRLFGELVEKRSKLEPFLESAGLTFDDIDLNKNSFLDVLAVFEQLINSSQLLKEDLFQIFDQRSARAFVSLLNSGTEATDDLKQELENAAGAAAKIRESRIDTLVGDYKILTSSVSSLYITFSELVAPAISEFVMLLTNSVRVVKQFVEENGELVRSIFEFVGLLAVASAAFGGFLAILGSIALIASVPVAILGAVQIIGAFVALAPAAIAFLGSLVVTIIALKGLLTGLEAAFDVFSKGRDDLSEYTAANLEVKTLLDETAISLEKVSERTRDLGERLDLLRNITNLNVLELERLKGLTDGEDLFGVNPTDVTLLDQLQKDLRELVNTKEELSRKSKDLLSEGIKNIALGSADVEVERQQRKDAGTLDEGIFSPIGNFLKTTGIAIGGLGRDQVNSLVRENALQSQADSIEEQRDKLQKQIDEINKRNEVFSSGNLIKEIFKVQNEITRIENEIARLSVKEKELLKKDPVRTRGLRADIKNQINVLRAEKSGVTEFYKNLEEIQKNATNEQIEALDSLDTLQDSDRVFEILSDISQKEKERAETAKKFIEARTDFDKTLSSLKVANLTTQEKGLDKLDTQFAKNISNSEILVQRTKDKIAEIQDDILKTQKIRDEAETLTDPEERQQKIESSTKTLEGLRKTLVDYQGQSVVLGGREVQLGGKLAELLAEIALLRSLEGKQRRELLEEEQESRLKTIRQLQLRRAEEKDAIIDTIRLVRELERAEAKRQLKSIFGTADINDLINRDADSGLISNFRTLQQALNDDLDQEIKKRLKISDILKESKDLLESINQEEETRVETATRKAEEEANLAQEKRTSLIDDIKSRLTADTLSKQAGDGALLKDSEIIKLEAELKRLKALDAKIEARRKRKKKEAKDAQADLELEFNQDEALKAAEQAQDAATIARINREKKEKAGIAEIEKVFQGQLQVIAQKTADLKRRLAQEEIKERKELEDKFLNQAQKTAKTRRAAAKSSNKLSEERAKLEKAIADKLTDQVKSLRDAKDLLMFIARIQRGAEARAEREALQALSRKRKLQSLENERIDIVNQGGNTTRIDNEIARIQIKLAVKQGAAAESFEKVGASAAALEKALNRLNGSVNTDKPNFRVPKPNINAPAIPAAPNVNAQGGKKITFNNAKFEFNIDGAGNPTDVANAVSDYFKNNFNV
jgi:TP901 family phage tail tape measure protein